ncbi:MAG: restriction endonuclease [Verrucomicrobiota bacterium]
MVHDPSAGKDRDVDITVTVKESGSSENALKAFEVKRERAPLDVPTVEQLCAKLLDMPSVTHRAIVSTSGFTEAAQSKAASKHVDLYEFLEWTRPLQEQFPLFQYQGTAKECFPGMKALLCWIDYTFAVTATSATAPFSVLTGDTLFNPKGKPHKKYPTFGVYQNEVLLRSTEILVNLEPAQTVFLTFPIPFKVEDGQIAAGPAWPHTHSIGVESDQVFVQTKDGLCQLETMTINGRLQWQRSDPPRYYVISKVPSGDAFAGALISTEKREGHMQALVISPNSREIGVELVQLAEKHLNCIRRLRLERP